MRSPLDPLDLDLVFSQQPPLTVREFRDACEHRGLDLSLGHGELEALHRGGALVPLYRLAKDVRAARAHARRQGIPVTQFLGRMSTRGDDLRVERDAGRLHDPRAESYRSWRHYHLKIDDIRRPTSEFLYSPYQLLLLPDLAPLVSRMRPRRPYSAGRFTLRLSDDRRALLQPKVRGNDALVIALTALESVYRPEIVERLMLPAFVSEESWSHLRETFDPVAMLRWIGWEAERVRETAEGLLTRAHRIDPLQGWHELARLCRPEKWWELRGDALVAVDHRVAAEILLRFYEDLAREGATPPLPPLPGRWWHPLRERLHANRDELDAMLTDFGLSPHPALVFVLEGATEMTVIPRVMDVLGIPHNAGFIEFVNGASATQDFGLLAAYAATPRLGEPLGDAVQLDRPATRFLVVLDPEESFDPLEKRQRKRRAWIERIYDAIPAPHRTPVLRSELENLVFVDTWGTEAFEFAHFTDDEIAVAILAAYEGTTVTDLVDLTARVGNIRWDRGNLEFLWRGWAPPNPSKVAVAEALWPTLEHKLRAAMANEALDIIPVARVVQHASILASEFVRHGLIMRRAE